MKTIRSAEELAHIAIASRAIAAQPGATVSGLTDMLARCDQKDWLPVSMEFIVTLSEWKAAMKDAIGALASREAVAA
jgi:hypothetical protein